MSNRAHSSAASNEVRARFAAEARAKAEISARGALERELLEAVRARAEVEARVQIAVEARARAEAYATDQGRRAGEAEAEVQRLREMVQELLPLANTAKPAPVGAADSASVGQKSAQEQQFSALRNLPDPPDLAEMPDVAGLPDFPDLPEIVQARPAVAAPRKQTLRERRRERKADAKRTRALLAQAKRTRALIARSRREQRKRTRRQRVPLLVHVVGITVLLAAGAVFVVPWGSSEASTGVRLGLGGGPLDSQEFTYSLLDMRRLENVVGSARPSEGDELADWLSGAPDAVRDGLGSMTEDSALRDVLVRTSATATLDDVTVFEGDFADGELSEAFGDPSDGLWKGVVNSLPFAMQRCTGGVCLWFGGEQQPAQLVEGVPPLSDDASVRQLVALLEQQGEPYLLEVQRSPSMGIELARLAGEEVPGLVTTGYGLAVGNDGATRVLLGFDYASSGAAEKSVAVVEGAVAGALSAAKSEVVGGADGEIAVDEAQVEVAAHGTLVVAEVALPEAPAVSEASAATAALVKLVR